MSDAAAVRGLLADVVEDPAAAALPDETPLLGGGLGLTSLQAAALVAAVGDRFGVDLALDDPNLDSLESIGALVAFVLRP